MEQLGVSNWLSETCRRLDIIHPTEIQKKCIPKVLKGLNVLGVSETGSGKTACFLLPIVQGFAVEARAFYALVILPTRELASQVMDQAVLFGQEAGLLSVLAVGGDSIYHQKEQMRSGVHLVVGTVGRLAQILEDDVALRKRFRRFKVVVLDEFDRILDPEYRQIGHLRKILPYFDKSPQLLFFSATFDKVKDWPRVEQHFPDLVDDVELQDVTSHSTPISIRHSFILCPKLGVYQYLNYLLRNCPDLVAPKRGILFVSKVLDSEVLVRLLVNLKHEAVCVNGVQRTSERATGLEKFRSGRGPRLLVGTDLISRGLDLPEVDFVINLSVPKNKTDYIHKAGRCGRAGRKGFVLTLVTPTLVGNRLEKDYQILQMDSLQEELGFKLTELQVSQDATEKKSSHVAKAEAKARIVSVEASKQRLSGTFQTCQFQCENSRDTKTTHNLHHGPTSVEKHFLMSRSLEADKCISWTGDLSLDADEDPAPKYSKWKRILTRVGGGGGAAKANSSDLCGDFLLSSLDNIDCITGKPKDLDVTSLIKRKSKPVEENLAPVNPFRSDWSDVSQTDFPRKPSLLSNDLGSKEIEIIVTTLNELSRTLNITTALNTTTKKSKSLDENQPQSLDHQSLDHQPLDHQPLDEYHQPLDEYQQPLDEYQQPLDLSSDSRLVNNNLVDHPFLVPMQHCIPTSQPMAPVPPHPYLPLMIGGSHHAPPASPIFGHYAVRAPASIPLGGDRSDYGPPSEESWVCDEDVVYIAGLSVRVWRSYLISLACAEPGILVDRLTNGLAHTLISGVVTSNPSMSAPTTSNPMAVWRPPPSEGRFKQIARAKATTEYRQYVERVPRDERKMGDPVTPRIAGTSWKDFQTEVRAWKRALHRKAEEQ